MKNKQDKKEWQGGKEAEEDEDHSMKTLMLTAKVASKF